MIKASYSDKDLITGILSQSFDTNKSVNFIVQQDSKRRERIKLLMAYSFEICYLFGAVYLSEDRKGCALILYPEKHSTTLKSIYLNSKLALQCIGITRIARVLKREALIKNNHPKIPISYLLFLAIDPAAQKQGIGSMLIQSVIQKSVEDKRDIYLETSTIANIAWYQKLISG